MSWSILEGDCIDVMRTLPDASVDSIVTDPPYGLGFMGKAWDDLPPGEEWARECLRVLKPGGHLLAFGGTRTWHRLACAVEDAGFEVRDSIAWLYGSGFPKSLDVSKAIDKMAPRIGMPAGFAAHLKERREALGLSQKDIAQHFPSKSGSLTGCVWNWENAANVPTPEQWAILSDVLGIPRDMWADLIARVEAEREVIHKRTMTQGGGTSLQIRMGDVREVRADITAPATDAAREWEGWGTALKPAFEPVVVARKPLVGTVAGNVLTHGTGALNIDGCRIGDQGGRWPANVVLDESQADVLDQQSGIQRDGVEVSERKFAGWEKSGDLAPSGTTYGGSGGASRFFYVAKAPKRERPRTDDGTAHPTVKPLALMRWLVRLVTPPGGVVLEPFAGSGTTVEACILEGFDCIAIEREAEYLPLIEARIKRAAPDAPDVEPTLFDATA